MTRYPLSRKSTPNIVGVVRVPVELISIVDPSLTVGSDYCIVTCYGDLAWRRMICLGMYKNNSDVLMSVLCTSISPQRTCHYTYYCHI